MQTHHGALAQIQQTFPPVIGYNGLSVLLGRSVGTLQADRCRKPHTIPPSCTPDGTKSPLWLTETVILWLKEFEEKQKQAAVQTPSANPKPRPGRPRKEAAK